MPPTPDAAYAALTDVIHTIDSIWNVRRHAVALQISALRDGVWENRATLGDDVTTAKLIALQQAARSTYFDADGNFVDSISNATVFQGEAQAIVVDTGQAINDAVDNAEAKVSSAFSFLGITSVGLLALFGVTAILVGGVILYSYGKPILKGATA